MDRFTRQFAARLDHMHLVLCRESGRAEVASSEHILETIIGILSSVEEGPSEEWISKIEANLVDLECDLYNYTEMSKLAIRADVRQFRKLLKQKQTQ